MAIDRAATLKNAEKLLRQGKVEPAIAEYLHLVEDQPRDWNLANTLGDLYARAGQLDKAIEQFTRIADTLNREGFLPKASAIYKKILKLKPDHEHALLEAAKIAGSLGLFADGRAYLTQVIDRRLARGDSRGAAEGRVLLGSLDPADLEARLRAAKARVEIGDLSGATGDLKEIATGFLEKGKPADALEALREAAGLSPDDDEIRQQLLKVYAASGDFARARECASTPDELLDLAGALELAGDQDAALEALAEAARLNPEDGELRARLARVFVGRGDLQRASEYLTLETAGKDVQLLFKVVEKKLRSEPEEGLAMVRRLLEQHPDRREQVALLGWTIADTAPEHGFMVVELAVAAAVAVEDWPSAAAALQEFVTRVPHHIPGLMRLVEICLEGGLEATMYSAQALLADAYIAVGQAAEARFIAEDLVAREPWDRSNLERFRRALELQGEPDPEALIAERLSGQSPFMTTDLFLAALEIPVHGNSQPEEPAGEPAPALPAVAHASSDSVDVDLSIVLEEVGLEVPPQPAAEDLETVFADLRENISRRSTANEAEQQFQRALALREAGDLDGCIDALQAAAHAPSLRFTASSLLARVLRDRGTIDQAVEWFERAAQAPPPSAEEGHALLYDLADALEKESEGARALAILLELQADAGSYRDVGARIDRLTKMQARG